MDESWMQFEVKSRDCDEVGPLKVGEFGRFPMFASVPCPAMFSVDLVRAARNTLRFLASVELEHVVSDALEHTCVVRYPAFLRLQAKAGPEARLVPPLDVAIGEHTRNLEFLCTSFC